MCLLLRPRGPIDVLGKAKTKISGAISRSGGNGSTVAVAIHMDVTKRSTHVTIVLPRCSITPVINICSSPLDAHPFPPCASTSPAPPPPFPTRYATTAPAVDATELYARNNTTKKRKKNCRKRLVRQMRATSCSSRPPSGQTRASPHSAATPSPPRMTPSLPGNFCPRYPS